MQPIKLNLKVYQGSTFKQILRWESSTKVYSTITNVTKAAPVVITSDAHGIPVGWRTKITNVVGMKEINSDSQYYTVTAATANTVTLNSLNTLGYTAYTSGGVLEYNMPVDLAGYTAKMQLRESIDSDSVIYELTTQNQGILLDNTNKTITITIPDSVTSEFDFEQAVYSLEFSSTNIGTFEFANGSLSLFREVTR